MRDYGPETEAATLAKLKEVRDQGVIGIGIGGSEQLFPPEPFAPLFREARRSGFRTNAHAGEAAGPGSIRGAITCLHVERIGHGTRAHEDPALLDYLAHERIPLEMCPMSNVRTGVAASLSAHPLRRYLEHGLTVTVNTDDPKMFGTSLAQEYRALVENAVCRGTKSAAWSSLRLRPRGCRTMRSGRSSGASRKILPGGGNDRRRRRVAVPRSRHHN